MPLEASAGRCAGQQASVLQGPRSSRSVSPRQNTHRALRAAIPGGDSLGEGGEREERPPGLPQAIPKALFGQ